MLKAQNRRVMRVALPNLRGAESNVEGRAFYLFIYPTRALLEKRKQLKVKKLSPLIVFNYEIIPPVCDF